MTTGAIQAMSEIQDISETASVVKVPREPAIIINGVPDLPSDCPSGSQPAVRDAPGSHVDPRFGDWLEGRKVRKLFEDQYYVGKVVNYDSESNWYSVVYEDGDQEDLEWDELEAILLPLDITIPLKTLVMDKCKLQNAVRKHKPKVARPKKVYAMLEGPTNETSGTVPLLEGTVAMKSSSQPRKRGRPRKDRTISGDIQPRKRGRPPKQNASDSIHKRNAETAKAEKLKRENMRVQGAPPGTQLF